MTDSRWPTWLPLRESLAPLSAYGAPQVQAEASLNTNENPFALSPELVSAITARVSEVASSLNRYPDRDALALRSALARYINELSGTSFNCNSSV